MKRAATQQGNAFNGNIVLAQNNGGIAQCATELGIAGTQLFANIGAAFNGDEIYFQAFIFVIAFVLGQHQRCKCDYAGRCR